MDLNLIAKMRAWLLDGLEDASATSTYSVRVHDVGQHTVERHLFLL